MRSSSSPARGFTLIELLVVVAALGMILWMSAQLFFPMRRVADRQRLQVEARQTARSAADYVAYTMRGASDMNDRVAPPNPATILPYVFRGTVAATATTYPPCPGTDCAQTSYNNVATGSNLADQGTDIITVARPNVPRFSTAFTWAGKGTATTPANNYWGFELGCPDSAANQRMFAELTCCDPDHVGDPATGTGMSTAWSRPLVIFDDTGNWAFLQITDYKWGQARNTDSCTDPYDSNCIADTSSGALRPCLWTASSPPNNAANAPGGQRNLGARPSMVLGLQFTAFRACQGWLEQKDGMFTAADSNCPAWDATRPVGAWVPKAGWSPLLPNVEDFQIAYIFRNGQVRNTTANQLTGASTADCPTVETAGLPAGVPCFGHVGEPFDATQVVGIRVTITGRSSAEVFGEGRAAFRRLVAEDHDPATDTPSLAADRYYRYQVSADALIRNRLPGR